MRSRKRIRKGEAGDGFDGLRVWINDSIVINVVRTTREDETSAIGVHSSLAKPLRFDF